jgi:hypothetical protein
LFYTFAGKQMGQLWLLPIGGGKGEAMPNHQGYIIAYLVGLQANVSRIGCINATRAIIQVKFY